MGKWSGLRGVAPPAPVDSTYQARVNAAKKEYEEHPKTDMGRAFCALRDEKDRLEELLKPVTLKLEAISQLMIADMERQGEDSFRLTSGDLLSIKDEPYCSVDNRDTFLNWVRADDQEDLLSVHHMTMNALVKDRLVNGLEPPPGIKVFLKQSIVRYKPRG